MNFGSKDCLGVSGTLTSTVQPNLYNRFILLDFLVGAAGTR
jgi:hypothetical protein